MKTLRHNDSPRLRKVEGRHNSLVKELRQGFSRGELTEAGECAIEGFRIIEEALANVRMHSGAQNVGVVLEAHSETEVALSVSDDGRGIDTDPLRPAGLGTIGMRERALFLGGRLWIENENGRGATVRAVFPTALLAAAPSPLPETITLEAQNHK